METQFFFFWFLAAGRSTEERGTDMGELLSGGRGHVKFLCWLLLVCLWKRGNLLTPQILTFLKISMHPHFIWDLCRILGKCWSLHQLLIQCLFPARRPPTVGFWSHLIPWMMIGAQLPLETVCRVWWPLALSCPGLLWSGPERKRFLPGTVMHPGPWQNLTQSRCPINEWIQEGREGRREGAREENSICI